MADSNDAIFRAAAFAARAHQHQKRKDEKTPYVSHVFRVCLVVRHLFDIADPAVLTAAILHDTIEDTTTDRDDIITEFGEPVAGWVATLTKDMRMPHDEREQAYMAGLAAAGWQVKICKLADLYDNLTDCSILPISSQRKTVSKTRQMLTALQPGLPDQAVEPFRLVEEKLRQLECEFGV